MADLISDKVQLDYLRKYKQAYFKMNEDIVFTGLYFAETVIFTTMAGTTNFCMPDCTFSITNM